MTNEEFVHHGMVFMDYAVVVSLVFTAVINMVILRDKFIPEPTMVSRGRRLIIAGYVILALWYAYLMITKGDLPISFPTGLSLLFLSIGSTVVGAARLQRRWQHRVDCDGYCGPERRCIGRRSSDGSVEDDTDWDHMA